MALHYDFTKVADFESTDPDERHVLTFATMAVGINRLTAENLDEFYARLSFWEKVNGAYLMQSDGKTMKDRPFTKDMLRPYIGMHTNASPKTEAAFRKDVWEAHKRWNVR